MQIFVQTEQDRHFVYDVVAYRVRVVFILPGPFQQPDTIVHEEGASMAVWYSRQHKHSKVVMKRAPYSPPPFLNKSEIFRQIFIQITNIN